MSGKHRRLLTILLTALCLTLRISAHADGTPLLRVEPGGHMAGIGRALFTGDGKMLISVGKDKAIRIWEIATGQLRSIYYDLRQMQGANEGLMCAVLSPAPQNTLLAVGQNDSGKQAPILLFDWRSGRQVRRLPGQLSIVYGLAFSPDGKWLASAGLDNLKLWEVATGKEVWHQEFNRGVDGRILAVYCVAFSPDGEKIAVGLQDGMVRLVDRRSGKLIKDKTADSGRGAVLSMDWHKNGTLAFAGKDGVIWLWNPDQRAAPQTPFPKQSDSITSIAFDPEGQYLVAGGGEPREGVENIDTSVHVYSLADGRQVGTYREHGATVWSVAVSPTAPVVASADGVGVLRLWDLKKQQDVAKPLESVGLPVASVRWSPDGHQVGWSGHPNIAPNTAFDLENGVLSPEALVPKQWAPPFALPQRQVRLSPDKKSFAVLDGAGQSLYQVGVQQQRDTLTEVSVTPDGGVIVASQFYLTYYAPGQKRPSRQFEGHNAAILSIAVSPNGRYLASGSSDQTVRIWDLKINQATIEPLLSVFHSTDEEWIAWVPAGYYNASPMGDRLIGWQVSQGPNREALFYDASRFAPVFYRPDVLFQLTRAGSLPQALQLASAGPDKPANDPGALDINRDLNKIAPPTVDIVSPLPEAHVQTSELSLRVRVGGDNAQGAQLYALVANAPSARAVREGTPTTGAEAELKVNLRPGRNLVRVYALQPHFGSKSTPVERIIYYDAPPPPRPYHTLHLLTVGIISYPGNGIDPLTYALADANSVAELYQKQQGLLFDKIALTALPDKEATKKNVEEAITALCKPGVVQSGDQVVLFFSGHGVQGSSKTIGTADRYKYYFCTADFVNTPDKWDSSGLAWGMVMDQLATLPCPVVMLLDTCHSGGTAMEFVRGFNPLNEFIRGANNRGLYALTSSLPTEQSLEHQDWGHGAFTKALLELERAPQAVPRGADGSISFLNAFNYLFNRVPAIVKPGQQTPKMFYPPEGSGNLPVFRFAAAVMP